MDDTHQFLPRGVINLGVKSRRGDVFERQPAIPIAPCQKARLTPAQRAFAVIQELEAPLIHKNKTDFAGLYS